MNQLPRTLVIHHRSGIGDLIWHIPYLRAIAARSEGGQVHVMARPSCKAGDVLAAEPCVAGIIEFDRKPRKGEQRSGRHDRLGAQLALAASLRAMRFDRVYIFSNRVRYSLLSLLAGIPVRAGFGFSWTERLFLNEPPFIERHRGPGNWVYPEATQFAMAHGFTDRPLTPRMSVLPEFVQAAEADLSRLPRTRYAFAIGTSEPRKDWGVDNFARLADQLIHMDIGVVLLGGPGESMAAQRMVDQLPAAARDQVLVCTQASVQRSAAVLRSCHFCIGNDTGALNMAVANGIPALGLFGSTPPLAHDPMLHALTGQGMSAIQVQDVTHRLLELNAPGLR